MLIISIPKSTKVDNRFFPWDERRNLEYCYTGLIRVSTPKQADENDSLAAQADEIKAFKELNELDFDRPSGDCPRDGFSYYFPFVFTAIERAWRWDWQVMQAAKHASVTRRVLVVPGLDRFSRQSPESINAKLVELDIWLLVLDLGIPVSPKDIWSGRHSLRERSRNSDRTARYKEARGGKKRGRPKKLGSSMEDVKTRELILMLHLGRFARPRMSDRKIAKFLNEHAVAPGRWNHKQIGRELERLDIC